MRNGKALNDDTTNVSPTLLERDILECDLKRLLLGVAIAAIAGPAWGQVQADYIEDAMKHCSIHRKRGYGRFL